MSWSPGALRLLGECHPARLSHPQAARSSALRPHGLRLAPMRRTIVATLLLGIGLGAFSAGGDRLGVDSPIIVPRARRQRDRSMGNAVVAFAGPEPSQAHRAAGLSPAPSRWSSPW